MAGSAARRGAQGQVRTVTNKEVLRCWRLAPCDVEAQTLVQNLAHHVQLIAALSGRLLAEQHSRLD